MAKHGKTFEETYPVYAFAPLVRLAVELGNFFAAARPGARAAQDDRSLAGDAAAS